MSGGSVNRASRETQGSNLAWNVKVRPSGTGSLTITLPETTNCSDSNAICTANGRQLSHSTAQRVQGLVGISIADGEVEEAAGARTVFRVSLSEAASQRMTVDWATSDGTAQAGSDYQNTTGTVTFLEGHTSRDVDVQVYDDEHNEGSETFTVTRSNASSGQITDATATGTITNHDALPNALIARFGRTAAVHIVEQVEERVNAPRQPGFDGRVAGRQINRDMGRDVAVELLQQLAGTTAHGNAGRMTSPTGGLAYGRTGRGGHEAGGIGLSGATPGNQFGTMNSAMGGMDAGGLDEMQAYGQPFGLGLRPGGILQGSEFELNRAAGCDGSLAFWSRTAQSSFQGRDGVLALNGDVRTTMFGADYARGRMVTGVSLSHSRGLGNYAGVDRGSVTSAVTGLYPWIGCKASERVTLWTVAGYGAGDLRLNPGGGPAIETELGMAMAAGGGRGQILGGGEGFGLAFKADALWVGNHVAAATGAGGNLEAANAAVSRLRAALEGSKSMTLRGRLALTPSVEVGFRHDGGDADTGTGMDLRAGLLLTDAGTGLGMPRERNRLRSANR